MKKSITLLVALLWLTGCVAPTTSTSEREADASLAVVAATTEPPSEAAPSELAPSEPAAVDDAQTTESSADQTDTTDTQRVDAQTAEQAADETPTNVPASEPEAMVATPIEVTYVTPSQAEGPYYTVDKPADRDNDLVTLAGATGLPAGDILEFMGTLYDASGQPVAGATVEIWQTDSNGIYMHPGDPTTAARDMNFQFYGESPTAADGSYSFRTILPGQYEPRPRHIHVKVKLEGRELLTTQFYFGSDDSRLADSLFADAGAEAEAMIMNVTENIDAAGNPILVGERDIILSMSID